MTKSFAILVFILTVATGFLLLQLFFKNNSKTNIHLDESTITVTSQDSIIKRPNYSDKKYNFQNNKIKSAIIPHHLLPSHIHADFFKRLSNQRIDTLIIIGPNHQNIGASKIISVQSNFDTEYGILETDIEKLNELMVLTNIEINNEVISNEHSITTLLPFVKYYLNDVKVLPIVMKSNLSLLEIENFIEGLKVIDDEYTVIIGSVDFSHYLNANEAHEKDQIMKTFIDNRDYNRILFLNSDYTDSGPSLISILKIADHNQTNQHILDNTNSGFLMNRLDDASTSYFYMLFTE